MKNNFNKILSRNLLSIKACVTLLQSLIIALALSGSASTLHAADNVWNDIGPFSKGAAYLDTYDIAIDPSSDLTIYSATGSGTVFKFTYAPPAISGISSIPYQLTNARVMATVNAKNAATTVTFEYGASTSYGTTLAAAEGTVTGASDTPVSAVLNMSGIAHGATCYYRIKAANLAGTTTSTGSFIHKASSAIILTSNANPSYSGQAVTFTATMISGTASPAGTVTFKDGANTLGTGAISSGKATFTTIFTTSGSVPEAHTITAEYGGDATRAASTSLPLKQYVNRISGVTAIAAGFDHSLALKSDGGVVGWGNNALGQITVPVEAISGVTSITAGLSASFALKGDGSVHAWGDNTNGLSTLPAGLPSTSAVSSIYQFALGLESTGTLAGWGIDPLGWGMINTTNLSSQTGVIGVAAGKYFGLALKNNGTVASWGWHVNVGGTELVVPADLYGVVAIAAGYNHALALKGDGSVAAWGMNGSGQTTVPAAAQSGVVAIAATSYNSIALKSDGSVVVWGAGGTLITGAPTANIVAIAGGGSHALGLKSDGTVIGWGDSSNGRTSPPYTATVTVSPTGPGTTFSPPVIFTSDVGNATCTWNGSAATGKCTTDGILTSSGVVLTAALPAGTAISSWGAGCDTSTATTCTISNLTGTKIIYPIVTLIPATLSVTATGNGTGSISSSTGGISYSYPASNSATTSPLLYGTPVSLTATATTGSTVSWTACSGVASGNGTTIATCSYAALDANKSAQATFTLNQHTLTVNKAGSGNGTVSGSGTYNYGSSNQISATVDPGSTFIGWSGDCSGTASPTAVIMLDRNMLCTATIDDKTPPVISNTSPLTGSFINTGSVGYTLNESVASGSIAFIASDGAADTSSPRTYNFTAPDMTVGSHTISGITLQNGTVYTITFSATDAAGNSAIPVTISNVTYDTSGARVTFDTPLPGSRTNSVSITYTLNETIASATVTASRTGGSEDASIHSYTLAGNELAVGSHTINTGFSLVSGAVYTFSITTITDQAGNPTPDVTVSGITFDSTALPIALTSPTSGSTLTTGQVGITLGEDAQSATITFTRTGGAEDPGAPHSYPLSGNDLLAGSRTITTNLPLVEGTVYSISLATTDLVGNQATTVTVTGVTFAVIHPLVLAGLPASAPYGQSGIVATVSGGNGSGAVSYSHGDSTACTVNATSGAVTITSGTGNCTITATKTADASFADTSSAPVSITITKANAAITLDSTTLDQDYIGTARIVTATTSPAGLSYSVTYNGSPTPPIAVGSYSIVATINDPNYQGSSSGTLIISDQSKPAISSFTALPRANYLIADITINASDNLLVTGYCLTEGGDSSGCAWSSTSPASYTFATPGPKTLTAYVRDAAGNISTGHGSTFTVSIPTLTVTVTGTGTGTVTSVPAGITCTTSSCTKELSGTVDLYATPSALSLFGGWSGGVCSGTAGICNVTMNGNKSVTATFSPAPLLHIDGTPYASLQAAYDAATSGAVIQLLETTTAGTLTANRPVTVKLKGGYNAAYSATPGETIVTAPLKIRQGKVLADKLNVR